MYTHCLSTWVVVWKSNMPGKSLVECQGFLLEFPILHGGVIDRGITARLTPSHTRESKVGNPSESHSSHTRQPFIPHSFVIDFTVISLSAHGGCKCIYGSTFWIEAWVRSSDMTVLIILINRSIKHTLSFIL